MPITKTHKPRRPHDRVLWQLRERVKELTALHTTAQILQRQHRSVDATMRGLLKVLPAAWQYPEITGVSITYAGKKYATANFRETPWLQSAGFRVAAGRAGAIAVCYLTRRRAMQEGPFLAEERALINSLAEMLQSFFQRRLYEAQLLRANQRLEQRVSRRTAALLKANRSLEQEINERKDRDRQLRALASALTLTEQNERREIAGNLHDHIGQALALARQKLQRLHGDAVFSGSEKEIETIQALIEQIIRYTRTLTVELSPPVLYELGLEPALVSLAEQFNKKHHLLVLVRKTALPPDINDDIRITLYTAARELLTNVVKHANAGKAVLSAGFNDGKIKISVADDGSGCPSLPVACDGAGFGLFSIRERLKHFGGSLIIESLPGRGTTVTVVMPIQQQPGKTQ